MDFRKTFINFSMLGLVIFGMFSFIIIFQYDNNSSERLSDNEIINDTYNNLYIELGEAQKVGNEQNTIFGETNPTQSYGEVEINSVVSPTKAFKSIILGVYNVLIKLPAQIFGVSEIVGGIISAILIILLIIGIWAIWKGSI